MIGDKNDVIWVINVKSDRDNIKDVMKSKIIEYNGRRVYLFKYLKNKINTAQIISPEWQQIAQINPKKVHIYLLFIKEFKDNKMKLKPRNHLINISFPVEQIRINGTA